MLDFKEPNIKIADISEDKKYGRFVVEPLERGYGTTSVSYTHLVRHVPYWILQDTKISVQSLWDPVTNRTLFLQRSLG